MDNRIIINKIKLNKSGRKYILECLNCHKIFELSGFIFNAGQGKFCCHRCSCEASVGRKNPMKESTKKKLSKFAKERLGKKASNWRGGKRINNGYIIIYSPEHPYPNFQKKYVYEHRLVMEKHLGRYLLPTEHVHHINKIKTDNRVKNLELFLSAKEHIKLHNETRERNSKGQFIH